MPTKSEIEKAKLEDAKVEEDARKTEASRQQTEDEQRVKQAKQSVEEERMENYGDTAGLDTVRGSFAQKPGIASDQPGAPPSRQATQEVRGTAPPPKTS